MNKIVIAILLLCIPIVFADTGISLFGTSTLDYKTNPFMRTGVDKVNLIIPCILIIVGIISFAIDFGTIGVCVGCILALILCYTLGIIAISITSMFALVILGGLIIFKMAI